MTDLKSAKHPYSSITGYATNNLWSLILSTATKIELAECVHHAMLRIDNE
jgi:hypothetical protein